MWYRTGTIAVTNGSATVTGTGTAWNANVAVGEALLGPDGKVYEIQTVGSDTSITLGSVYLGSNASGQDYVIAPTQSYIRDLAVEAASLVNSYATIAATTGVGRFEDGTVSAPGITFDGDRDNGLYRIGTNNPAIAAGGTKIQSWATTGSSVFGTLSVSGALTSGAAGFTGAVTSTQSAADTSAFAVVATASTRTKVFGATGSTSAGMYGLLANTGGSLLWGVENSGGGNIVTGSAAYSAYIGTNTNTALAIAINSVQVGVFNASGMNGVLGATTPAAASVTTLSATGNVTLGDASTDTLNVGNGGLIKDASGNLGASVTPSAWNTSFRAMQIGSGAAFWGSTSTGLPYAYMSANTYYDAGNASRYLQTEYATWYVQEVGTHKWYTAPSGTAGNVITWTDVMTLDEDGNLTVAGTVTGLGDGAAAEAFFGTTTSAGQVILNMWNKDTSGDNLFTEFYTEAGGTLRGSIYFNRAGGLIAYATTSDYRAKDIEGPVTNSGSIIDTLSVYMGRMHGATIARPMMIAHEAQAVVPYAVTGEKDAVDAEGEPVYQSMDHQILVPLLIAEVQSLRSRVALLEA